MADRKTRLNKKIKPSYKHPEFVLDTADKRIETENKRLWLYINIDKVATESMMVILKNLSRATKDISDKTVFTVTNYVHRNREKYSAFKNIGTLIIVNLIPFYETYSDQLRTLGVNMIDKQNQDTITDLTSKHKNVIIAWGDHPKGLYKEYEQLKQTTFDTLITNKNNVFYVGKLSKNGNPKHGQVWGYEDELLSYTFDRKNNNQKMFQEPITYTDNDHFFYTPYHDLEKVCNAPKDKEGVFKVLELRNGKINLVYIGFSNSGGLYNEIVNGLHFDKNPRKVGWTNQTLKDKTDALDVYWYVTNGKDAPKKEQVDMLKDFVEQTGKLPKWNK